MQCYEAAVNASQWNATCAGVSAYASVNPGDLTIIANNQSYPGLNFELRLIFDNTRFNRPNATLSSMHFTLITSLSAAAPAAPAHVATQSDRAYRAAFWIFFLTAGALCAFVVHQIYRNRAYSAVR